MRCAALGFAVGLAACGGGMSRDAAPRAASTPATPHALSPQPTFEPASRTDTVAPRGSAAAAGCDVAPIATCSGDPPSFAADVQPILKRRCWRCHADEGVAAEDHDFTKFETLRAQRTEFADAVTACAMPPRTRLDETEARTLLRWVACGARPN